MKISLVYDRVNKFGGAERVLQALHEIWPDAPLYTSVYNPQTAKWAKDWDIRPSFLNRFPFTRRHHEYFFLAMPYAFESLNLDEFDVIVSVTSAEAKGVITKPHQLHLCYLLTPTRYLWSHTHDYSHSVPGSIVPGLSTLRQWDYVAAQRPDYLIPISAHVAKRTHKYYQRQTGPIIYPPVNVRGEGRGERDQQVITAKPRLSTLNPQPYPYFLLVSRLVAYKNINTAIQAFNQLPDQRLIIIGRGKEEKRLKRIAKDNTVFLSDIHDLELQNYYIHAQALIFPQEEDFGIVAVEAQAYGTPVIAWDKGAARETIMQDKTGLLYAENTPANLVLAIREFMQKSWYDDQIIAHAQQFSRERFKQQFKAKVEELWQTHQKQ